MSTPTESFHSDKSTKEPFRIRPKESKESLTRNEHTINEISTPEKFVSKDFPAIASSAPSITLATKTRQNCGVLSKDTGTTKPSYTISPPVSVESTQSSHDKEVPDLAACLIQSSFYEEDPTQTETAPKCDDDKFRRVFGITTGEFLEDLKTARVNSSYCRSKNSNSNSNQEPTWLKNAREREEVFAEKDRLCGGHNTKEGTRLQRFKHTMSKAAFNALRGVLLCCYTCYAICPPIPSMVTRKVAFHPPRRRGYFFVIRNEKNQEVHANAKQAYCKKIKRVDLEMPNFVSANRRDVPIDNVYPMVVKTERRNYLSCIYVPCRLLNRPKELNNKVIIFCQPNSSDLSMFLWKRHIVSFISLRDLTERTGCDVVAFDYSGFGISSGTASEANVYADVRAIYAFVRRERPECKIYLMGFSLGTAAAVDLASTQPEGLAGVILIAPFTSGARVMLGSPRRERSYLLDAFENYEKAPSIEVPVLIIHGLQDDIIPFEHGAALLRRMHKPLPIELVRRADHSSILLPVPGPVFGRIVKFLFNEAERYDEYFTREAVFEQLDASLEKIRASIAASSARSAARSSRARSATKKIKKPLVSEEPETNPTNTGTVGTDTTQINA